MQCRDQYPVVHTHLLLHIQYTILAAASRLKRVWNISRSSKQTAVHFQFRKYLKLKLFRVVSLGPILFCTLSFFSLILSWRQSSCRLFERRKKLFRVEGAQVDLVYEQMIFFFFFQASGESTMACMQPLGRAQEQQCLDEAIPTETSNLTTCNQVYCYYC